MLAFSALSLSATQFVVPDVDVEVNGDYNFVAANTNDIAYQGSHPAVAPKAQSAYAPVSASVTASAKSEILSVSDVKLKSSSLSYANAAGRAGFDFDLFYNDFTNEGNVYPLHGVGDFDTTIELLEKFIKSSEGLPFSITDLGINVKVTDPALTNENCFFDYHNIPTKMLDGSAKLGDGSRIESHIKYFTKKNHTGDLCAAKIDWISGNAKFVTPELCKTVPGFADVAHKELPTTLASTRATPFLQDKENLALTFFMDGKQARLTNGGSVSNWRYVVPQGMGKPIAWFVAKAMRPCQDDGTQCEYITTTDGKKLKVQARTASETENLQDIAYEPRYMKTVSDKVPIYGGTRAAAFNQRYGNKCADFGDVMLKKVPVNVSEVGLDGLETVVEAVKAACDEYKHDKQMQFYEMLKVIKDNGVLSDTYIYDTAPLSNTVKDLMQWFIDRYVNTETFNISPKALVNKAFLAPSYMWSPICETGWLVVEAPEELTVPADSGEYFIGWVIETQPMFDPPALDSMIRPSVVSATKLQELVTKGYALHNGPGMIYETCGDFAHHGTQEPYLLEYNSPPVQQVQLNETDAQYASRKQSQLPTVHWRLADPETIFRSLNMDAVTEANVAAGQMMLASIGTKTPKQYPSRSKNFLGEFYQNLLYNKTLIEELCAPGHVRKSDEVYDCVGTIEEGLQFSYGVEMQASANYQT
jgi:hypothetical protein